jgi:hypothetical protein
MAQRLWGCYSVVDHLKERAFVADLLLYDRLVVPVPSSDGTPRWEESWNPARQERLLEILGPFAERVEWTAALRDRFEDEWVPESARRRRAAEWWPGGAASHIDSDPPDESQRRLSRGIVATQLQRNAAKAGDVRAVAVYAQPDRFDRDWQLSWTLPIVKRSVAVERGELREPGPTSA